MDGKGDKEGADDAAVNAMRFVLRSVNMDGVVIIGEGEKMKRRCSTMVKRLGMAPLQSAMLR